MKMTKQQLIEQLDFIKKEIELNDSFEGSFSYSCMDDDCGPFVFKVKGAVRIGNSKGQGGMRHYGD